MIPSIVAHLEDLKWRVSKHKAPVSWIKCEKLNFYQHQSVSSPKSQKIININLTGILQQSIRVKRNSDNI